VQTELRHARVAAQRSEGVDWLGRAGLVAQGVLYGLVAVLAIQVALEGRDTGERPDAKGALQLVAEQPVGPVLLAALGLGLAGYALWRIVEAVVDRDHVGSDWKGLAQRAAFFGLGLLYLGLAGVAFATALDVGRGSGGGGGEAQQATQGVLGWPLGRPLVLAVGVGLVVGAAAGLVYAVSGKHQDKLETGAMSRTERRVGSAVGLVGYAARAVVFAVIGIFVVKAAWQHDPGEARGLDGALLELAQAPLGPVVLGAVALGLLAFAAWCGVEARYRRI
jgi:hypothetical protein